MIDEYFHILFDPSHTLVELTYIMVDLIILKLIWKVVKGRWDKHMHRDIAAGKHVKENQ